MKLRRPLLAATLESLDDLKHLRYPVWVSEKKDGIRGIITGSGIVSRTLKPLPNYSLQKWAKPLWKGIEGEIVTSDIDGNDADFEDTESAIMSQANNFQFSFYIFDWIRLPSLPYKYRYSDLLQEFLPEQTYGNLQVLSQFPCFNPQDVIKFYDRQIKAGAEGIMIRDPLGFYKHGRSTLSEQLLIKLKPWLDAEATIIGFTEAYENQNEKQTDERGYTKRARKFANLQKKGTLGAIKVRSKIGGDFEIGTGFDAETGQRIWNDSKQFLGRKLNFRYRGLTKYGKPKHASFVRLCQKFSIRQS